MTLKKEGKRQVLRARRIENSHIEQIIGSKYVVRVDPATDPIYLTYADSDVQALFLSGHPGAAQVYAEALNETVRLLLCFKPPGSTILVSPSSLLQSRITRHVLMPFLRGQADMSLSQILVLRRESSWTEYFAKRHENSEVLRSLDTFAHYFDPQVIREISSLPASRKKFFSGDKTVEKWSKAVHAMKRSARLTERDIADAAHELLQRQAFVYETSSHLLQQLDIRLRPDDVRSLLVDTYLSSVASGCAVPTAIRLPWDPCPATAGTKSYSISVMRSLTASASMEAELFDSSASDLLRFADSQEMQALRMQAFAYRSEWMTET